MAATTDTGKKQGGKAPPASALKKKPSSTVPPVKGLEKGAQVRIGDI